LSKAETNTDIKDELAVSFQHTIDSLATAIDTDFSFTPKIQNVYDGSGKTTRSASIQAKVAARVTKLLDNGNIKIVGKHLIEVNGEEQEITITGVVRTKDISQQSNAVYSYQVANAKIVVKGSGMVAEAEQPGWLTRIVNWLF
jgi:flagellar L-ring protein precursor FlgH